MEWEKDYLLAAYPTRFQNLPPTFNWKNKVNSMLKLGKTKDKQKEVPSHILQTGYEILLIMTMSDFLHVVFDNYEHSTILMQLFTVFPFGACGPVHMK